MAARGRYRTSWSRSRGAKGSELTALNGHVRAFATILTTHSGQHLKDWILAARVESLAELHTVAHGLERA